MASQAGCQADSVVANGRPLSPALKGKKIGFEKIVATINETVMVLKKEGKDDADSKEYCTSQIDVSEDKEELENSLSKNRLHKFHNPKQYNPPAKKEPTDWDMSFVQTSHHMQIRKLAPEPETWNAYAKKSEENAGAISVNGVKFFKWAAYCHFGREAVTMNGVEFFEWENAKDVSKYAKMTSDEVDAAPKASNCLSKYSFRRGTLCAARRFRRLRCIQR